MASSFNITLELTDYANREGLIATVDERKYRVAVTVGNPTVHDPGEIKYIAVPDERPYIVSVDERKYRVNVYTGNPTVHDPGLIKYVVVVTATGIYPTVKVF